MINAAGPPGTDGRGILGFLASFPTGRFSRHNRFRVVEAGQNFDFHCGRIGTGLIFRCPGGPTDSTINPNWPIFLSLEPQGKNNMAPQVDDRQVGSQKCVGF